MSCCSSCTDGRSSSNSGGDGGVGFPHTFFSPDMSSVLTQKLPSRQVFAFVKVNRFLTILLFLKLLHILMLLQVWKVFQLLFKDIHKSSVLLFCKPKEHLNSQPSECLGSLGCINCAQLEFVEKHAQRTSPCEI